MNHAVTARPFRFKASCGSGIKGLLYEPAAAGQGKIGYMYLPGIVLGSSAVHRLGVELGHRIARAGHPFCLFDHVGIGESEGEYPEGTHQQLCSWVEEGNLVESTIDAVDEFQRRTNVSSVALIGHCGGALTSIYTLSRDPRIRAALLLSPPTVVMGRRDEHAREMVVDQGFSIYLRKITSLEAWQRLLGGRSDYELLLPILRRKIGQVARRQLARLGVRRAESPIGKVASVASPGRDFNPRLEQALVGARSSGKLVRVVFGDRDPDVDDFREFLKRHPTLPHGILRETSHGFVTEASQALLWAEIDEFTALVSAHSNQ